jgi:hypothetical protein
MLLKTKDFELEIRENAFVCLEDEAATNFCEWQYLDPHLREKFSRIRRELLEVMEAFVTSDDRQNFRRLSEEYKKDQAGVCAKPE